MGGRSESRETRLVFFAQQETPSERFARKSIENRAELKDRNELFTQRTQEANELLQELQRRIEELERKNGDATEYKTIAERVQVELKKWDETFRYYRAVHDREVLHAVWKDEWDNPNTMPAYGSKAWEKASAYWLGIEDQILDRFTKMLTEYTGQAQGVGERMQANAAQLHENTGQALDNALRYREKVFDERGVREAEQKVREAEEKFARAQKETAGRDIPGLLSQRDTAVQAFNKATAALQRTQEDVKQKQEVVETAQRELQKIEPQQSKIAQLNEDIKVLEKNREEQQSEQARMVADRQTAEQTMRAKDSAINVKLAQDRAAIGPLGTPPDPFKQNQVKTLEEKASADKALNADEKNRRQQEIDRSLPKITEAITALTTQIGEKKAEQTRMSAALPPVPDVERLKAAWGDAKAAEEKQQKSTDALRASADAAKSKYEREAKPLTEAAKQLEEAKTRLQEAKKAQREVTDDERQSYRREVDKAVQAIEREGSLLFRNFRPQQKLEWVERTKAADGTETTEKRSTTVQVRIMELLKERTGILDDLADRATKMTRDDVERVLRAIREERRQLQGNLTIEGAEDRMSQLLTLERKWKPKEEEYLAGDERAQAVRLREATEAAKGKGPAEQYEASREELQFLVDRHDPKDEECIAALRKDIDGLLTERWKKFQEATESWSAGGPTQRESLEDVRKVVGVIEGERVWLEKRITDRAFSDKAIVDKVQARIVALGKIARPFVERQQMLEKAEADRREQERVRLNEVKGMMDIARESERFDAAVRDLDALHRNVQGFAESVQAMSADVRASSLDQHLSDLRAQVEAMRKRQPDWSDQEGVNGKKFLEIDETVTRLEQEIDPLVASPEFKETQRLVREFLSEIRKTEGEPNKEAVRNALINMNMSFRKYRELRSQNAARPDVADQQARTWEARVNQYLPTTQFYQDYILTFDPTRDQVFLFEKK